MQLKLMVCLMTDTEAQEIINALIDYSCNQVLARMIAYGEPFEVALANYIEEIENEPLGVKNGKI